MDVELPDGTVVKDIPEGTTKAQLTNKLIAGGYGKSLASSADVAMADPTRDMSFMDNVRAGVGKGMTNMGRGVAQIVGAGPSSDQVKAQRATDAPLQSTVGGKVGNFIGSAAPLALSAWIPGVNSVAGAVAAGGAMGAAEPVTDEESRALNAAIGGGAGVLGKAAGDKIASTVVSKLAARKADMATKEGQNAVRDTTLKASQDAGYVLPPSAVNPTWLGNRMESIAGKAATGQQAAATNQATTNKLAREALGLPESQAISMGTLEGIRKAEGQTYAKVAALSKDAADALEQLKQARFDANAQWKFYGRSADPKALEAAKKATADVQIWEKLLESEAQSNGRADLIPALQSARERIAKTYDVERALNTSTGDVSAQTLARAIDKGKYMSGELETAGRFADAFPALARDGAKVPQAGVSKSEAILGTLLAVGGSMGMGTPGALLGALPLLSGPMRGALLSKVGQKMMAQPQAYSPSMRAQIAALLTPQVAKATPALSAQGLLLGNPVKQDTAQ